MIAFCRTTIFEFWKSTALMLAPAILPIFDRQHMLGLQILHVRGPIFGAEKWTHFWGR
jgi:hypothetical protein